MGKSDEVGNLDDRFDLGRFIEAQDQHGTFSRALAELRRNRKETHWMWFIFPQIDGLVLKPSLNTEQYAIHSLEEALAYLDHPVLGGRLRECAEALMGVNGKSATAIMGSPDDMKLQSSMTLFAQVAKPGSVFSQVLDKYYEGRQDKKTIERL